MHYLRRFSAFFAALCLLATPALAHSGRTDSHGGHYDRSTGEYHFHHGYKAHQHPNGVCPYASPTVKPTAAATSKPAKQSAKRSDDVPVAPIVLGAIGASIFGVCRFCKKHPPQWPDGW